MEDIMLNNRFSRILALALGLSVSFGTAFAGDFINKAKSFLHGMTLGQVDFSTKKNYQGVQDAGTFTTILGVPIAACGGMYTLFRYFGFSPVKSGGMALGSVAGALGLAGLYLYKSTEDSFRELYDEYKEMEEELNQWRKNNPKLDYGAAKKVLVSYIDLNGLYHTNETFYQVLGVKSTDAKETVRKAYLNRSRDWHPDKNPEKKQQSTELMQLLVTISEVMSDANQRDQYNSKLQQLGITDDKNPYQNANKKDQQMPDFNATKAGSVTYLSIADTSD
jgi:hypothetical protein